MTRKTTGSITTSFPLTKKFTSLCHFILGIGLSLAPIGAYIAVTGEFAVIPIIYSMVVLLWVSGFDGEKNPGRDSRINSPVQVLTILSGRSAGYGDPKKNTTPDGVEY